MPLRRDNDEERAAVVDRLLQDYRRQHPREYAKALLDRSNAAERRQMTERRRGRSDTELRRQREELERRWNERHRRGKPKKAS